MEQYIPKSAVVAEIKNLIERAEAERVLHPKTILAAKNYLLIEDYKKLLSFIDSLEVKEVDLDEEIDRWQGYEAFPEGVRITPLPKAMEIVKRTAKHFFELGLKVQKGEEV